MPYELGSTGTLYPIFVRGEAYLAAHQGNEAAAEFQKIIDHRGIVQSDPIGPLAHLGLARAYGLQGETAKARAAYQAFLNLWKDADPDIPSSSRRKPSTLSCSSGLLYLAGNTGLLKNPSEFTITNH